MSPEFTPTASLIGGLLIGLSATLMLLLHGRITGISGIVRGIIAPEGPRSEHTWRVTFVVGLLLGGLLLLFALPDRFELGINRSLPATVVAGLLVGVGTRMGGGCTSGHGVCGVSRLAPRSLIATITFIGTGGITVTLVRTLFGGSL